MSLWPSKTKMWNGKTRVTSVPIKKTNNGIRYPEEIVDKDEKENENDYLELEDKIISLEAQVKNYEERLKDKCVEIVGLQRQLSENTIFMQKVIFELIQLKSAPVSNGILTPKTALEKYIEKKNSSSTVAKLP